MNRVIMLGRLTKDAEIRMTQSGKKVATFSLAVDRRKGQNGPTADFFSCIAWERIADVIERYTSKGKQIILEGMLQNRSYDDKNGPKRYVTEIIVTNLKLLGGGQQSHGGNQQPGYDTLPLNEDVPF